MTAEMSAKKRGKKRLDIILDMGCFFHLNRMSEIPAFEEAITARADKQSTVICCYHGKDIAKLDERARENVGLNHVKSFAIVENQ
jgi:hypothetical protein